MENKSTAAVCCYFNPCNYQKKYDNFIRFYHSLSQQISRIQVVELSSSKLPLPDYVNSLKVKSKSILWHKENLLNLGIDILLAEGYANIAWLDSDVLFLNSSWVLDMQLCLEKHNLCQLFASSESFDYAGKKEYFSGCVRYWLESGNILPINEPYSMGYGWAARSEVLSQCNLYDKAIVGGGDSLMWLSCFSKHKNIHKLIEHHPIRKLNCVSYYVDFVAWSELWGDLIEENVSCTFNPIVSLSHGSFKNRQYISRYNLLPENNYDPSTDLFYNDLGVLECRKENLNKQIYNYLKSRNEDELSWLQKLLKT